MPRFLALTTILLAASCQSGPGPDLQEPSVSLPGEMIVERQCSACHATGRGDRSRHPDAPAFRTLGRRYPIVALEEALAEGIMVGHPDMPEFQFDAAQVADIISYLQSIQN